MAGEVWGPIDVPVSIARACRVGRDIGGVVVQTRKGWRLIKVWGRLAVGDMARSCQGMDGDLAAS